MMIFVFLTTSSIMLMLLFQASHLDNCCIISFNHQKSYKRKVVLSPPFCAQLCPILCHPMDCSPPGPSVHGIFQARKLEWVTISFSRGSSWSRDWTWVSCISGRFFTIWATRKAVENTSKKYLSLFAKGKKRFPYSLHIILMIKVITFL